MLNSVHRTLRSLKTQPFVRTLKSCASSSHLNALNKTPSTLIAEYQNGGVTTYALRSSGRWMSTPSSVEEVKAKDEGGEKSTGSNKIPQHSPSKLDKFTLVFTRTMKAHEIGSEVSLSSMEKANTRRRIMINVCLMVFTVFGSIYSIRRGKKDSKTDNVYEINKRR